MDLNLSTFDVIIVIFALIGMNILFSISKMVFFKLKIKRIQNINNLRRKIVLKREKEEMKKKKRVIYRMKKKSTVYNINGIDEPVNMNERASLPPKKEEKIQQITYDTKRDMEFLEHLIEEKCTAYIMIDLSDFIEDEKAMASEDLIRESVRNIGMRVYNSLSSHYLERLSYYFDNKELLNYIFDKAFVTITPLIIKKHKNNII